VDAAERARLVESHLDLARKAAALIYPRVRGHVELAELISLGNTALAEAAARYAPGRAPFRTFAWYRVQGAMIDALRRQAPLPKRVWARLVALRATAEYLEQRGAREDGAVARGAQPSTGAQALAEVRDAMHAIRAMYVVSLDALRTDRDAALDVPGETAGPLDALLRARVAAVLHAALEALPERERTLVRMHYYEGRSFVEAAAAIGVSKSWASRLHAQAVERVRAAVNAALADTS
jgi:RNA polymerase sigma factor for flagellar operon FliA